MRTYEGVNEVSETTELDFGMELILGLRDVNPDLIRDHLVIANFAVQLVKFINMKPYGPPQVVHFGHADPNTSGYTLVQLIETSSITAHFSEGKNSAYINVFSCKRFEPMSTVTWIARFWEANGIKYRAIPR